MANCWREEWPCLHLRVSGFRVETKFISNLQFDVPILLHGAYIFRRPYLVGKQFPFDLNFQGILKINLKRPDDHHYCTVDTN